MIHHIVMCTLRADHDPAELQKVMEGLDALRNTLSGFSHFTHGPNQDFEGLSTDCHYAFVCLFADAPALRHYAQDPGHRALGKRLLALCEGGVTGLRVVDMAETA